VIAVGINAHGDNIMRRPTLRHPCQLSRAVGLSQWTSSLLAT
jgi:hypothetical protein